MADKGWRGHPREVAKVLFSDGSEDPEVHANAHLIAVTPELFETLNEVREACLFSADNDQIGVTTDPHISEELFDKICSVLNKAGNKT